MVDSIIEKLLNSFLTSAEFIVIAIVITGFIGYVCRYKPRGRRFTELTPNFMTSLGILGTFFGIVKGLYHFDPQDIDSSIPTLLEGLKTAFNTSIFGVVGSFFFKISTTFFGD